MGIREQQAVLFGSDQGSIRLLLKRNADQMSLLVHYIHLCFQARKSDESHLAPQPGLLILLIDCVRAIGCDPKDSVLGICVARSRIPSIIHHDGTLVLHHLV